jgi:hypothetical protein
MYIFGNLLSSKFATAPNTTFRMLVHPNSGINLQFVTMLEPQEHCTARASTICQVFKGIVHPNE